jgi:choline dehydrogenase-like flavoprotein
MTKGQEYDYVIVGAGSAGCGRASPLTQPPDIRGLLLEPCTADRHPSLA